jgi:hypothetical protein
LVSFLSDSRNIESELTIPKNFSWSVDVRFYASIGCSEVSDWQMWHVRFHSKKKKKKKKWKKKKV